MSKIKTFTFSSLKKFFRDNEIKYLIFHDGLSIYDGQRFPRIIFQIEEENTIAVHTLPLRMGTHRFKATNIYSLLSSLMEIGIINDVDGYYIRGIHGTGRPPKKIKPKIIQLYGRNGILFKSDPKGKAEGS